jgi:hypothetical protein
VIIIYFLLGVLFIAFVYPILEAVSGVIITFLEMIKGFCSVKITEMNAKMRRIGSEENTRAVGFTFESEEEDIENV